MIYDSKLCFGFVAVMALSLFVLFSHDVYGQISNSTIFFHTGNATITIHTNLTSSPTIHTNSTYFPTFEPWNLNSSSKECFSFHDSVICLPFEPWNLNSSSKESYYDIVVGPNIIHRVWHNMSPPKVHSDLGEDQKIGMNLIRVNQLDEEILYLPASNFTTTMSSNQSQTILHQNVTDIGTAISNDQEHLAVDKLKKLREKMDGSLGGNPSDDLVIDPNAQKRITLQVDGLIHVLDLDTQPSDSVHKEVTPPSIPSNSKPVRLDNSYWGYAEIGLAATSIVLGGIIGYRIITGKKATVPSPI